MLCFSEIMFPMNNGVFIIESDSGQTISNGVVIQSNDEIYLLTCAHTFYHRSIKNIHFFIEPLLDGTSLRGAVELPNLPKPVFHPDETDKSSFEVAIIKLNKDQKELLNSKEISPSKLYKGEFKPDMSFHAKIIGHDSNIINDEGFQGLIPVNSFDFKFILRSKEINASNSNTDIKSIDNYVFAKNKDDELGFGYSGSPVYDKESDEIVGVFHRTGNPLSNGFDKLTPNGIVVIASVNRIKETIEKA